MDNIVQEEDEEEDAEMDAVDGSKNEEVFVFLPPSDTTTEREDNEEDNESSLASIEERLDRALSEVSSLNVDNLATTMAQSMTMPQRQNESYGGGFPFSIKHVNLLPSLFHT